MVAVRNLAAAPRPPAVSPVPTPFVLPGRHLVGASGPAPIPYIWAAHPRHGCNRETAAVQLGVNTRRVVVVPMLFSRPQPGCWRLSSRSTRTRSRRRLTATFLSLARHRRAAVLRRLQPARRGGASSSDSPRHDAAAGVAESRQPARDSELAQFRGGWVASLTPSCRRPDFSAVVRVRAQRRLAH